MSSKASVENCTELKTKFLSDVNIVVQMENVPPELILNWDQTDVLKAIHWKHDMFIISMIQIFK